MNENFSLSHRKKTCGGSVLVLAVFVLMLLSFWVLEFAQGSLFFQRQSGNFLERKRADLAARAGLEYCLWLLDRKEEETFDGTRRLGEAAFSYQVRNEDGKWDLNGLIDGDGNLIRPQAEGIGRFLDGAGLGESKREIVEGVADWLDRDRTRREFGAEEADYSETRCRNGALLSASELTLVRGVDNLERARQLRRGVTVYSGGKINVNTAPPEVLASLSPLMNEPLVRNLCRVREKKRFQKVEDLKNVLGMRDYLIGELEERLEVRGKYYSIVVTGSCGKTAARLGAVARRESGGMKLVELKEPLQDEDLLDLD